MAKTKKKKNYRLRKSVRRTLGALFMISAIIIAAIPFPDAVATNGETNQEQQGNSGSSDEVKLLYGGADGTIEDETIAKINTITTSGNGIVDIEEANKLVEIGGNLQYMWQYKYVYDSALGGAVIVDYNEGYTVENVTLDPYVNSANYLYVTQNTLKDATHEFKVDYSDWTGNTEEYQNFKYYFSTDTVNSFNTACQNYKTALDNATSSGTTLGDSEITRYETAIESAGTANLSSIRDDNKRKEYYLEYIGEFDDGSSEGFAKTLDRDDFSLVYALKPKDHDPKSYEGIYIVKRLNPNVVIDGFTPDSDGLMCNLLDNAPVLIGIGKGAFSNVTTGVNLTLPKELQYIADEAFMNSYVKEITINSVKEIGNRAFKDSKLESLNWTTIGNTEKIGAEAFSGTFLTSVSFPQFLRRIGEGAFANCLNLQNIEIHPNSSEVSIGDYAFYNCIAMNSVDFENKNVGFIGEGAFAVKDYPRGNFTSFKFPQNKVDETNDLGDFILAGRETLEEVLMPATLGFGSNATLKDNIFLNCRNLKCVEFPVTCREVTFTEKLFRNVTTSDFYVKGPKLGNNNQDPAGPRQSTWKCKIVDGSPVPYMYKDTNGNEFYEICEEQYVKLVDDQGILQSCEFVNKPSTTVPLNIKGTVGNKTIVGIADNCFSEEFLKYINSLTIEDDVAIKTIGNGSFAGATQLKDAYIGNLVESIGDDSFNGCTSLKKVTFGTGINNIGARAFKGCSALTEIIFEQPVNRNDLEAFAKRFPRENIGQDAFALNESEKSGTQLTLTGVIDPEYGPFVWAMEPDNFVNRSMGIRVCYNTGAPTYQTVILDNKNNLPTLVDYLHYSDLESIKATYEVIDMPNLDDNIATIDDASDSSQNGEQDNTPTVTTVETNLRDKYENYPEQLNATENYTVDAAINLVIPAGIKSIDVSNFIKDSSEITPDASYSSLKNSINVAAYMSSQEANNLKNKVNSYKTYGLFNSNYEDKIGDAIGNDMIETVTMHTVEYLPNNDSAISNDDFSKAGLAGGAFYDCDKLQTVRLGSEMRDIGELPFLGCHELNNVACSYANADGAPKYECINKIIYENLDDGSNTKKIIQCLNSRGNYQDSKIDTTNDSYFANVSSISDGAFSDCVDLKTVDFTGNSILTELPNGIFFNADKLSRVDIPETIRIIGKNAFANIDGNPHIYIYGKEVSMAHDSFDNSNATVHTYKGSAAHNIAEKLLGIEGVEPILEEEPLYTVTFYDYDFETVLLEEKDVKSGETVRPPYDPTREGYKFVGWSTDEWETGVTKDLDVIAMYDAVPPSTDGSDNNTGNGTGNDQSNNGSNNNNGNNNNNNNNSNDKNNETNKGTYVDGGIDLDGDGIPDVDKDGNKLYKLTVTNGEGSGYYKAGQTVTIKAGNAPTGSGFAYWSCSNNDLIFNDHTDWITTLTMVAKDVTVICNFRGQYTLEVEYGSGSGSYPAGAKVSISAVSAPKGKVFAKWVTETSGLTIDSSTKESTIITMPAAHSKVTATYEDEKKENNTNGNNGNSSTTKPSDNNTSVIITKPGISDKDKASAYVSGSSDNFIVKISESLDAADEVQRALQKKYPDMSRIKYFAMDITLYDAKGENKITNTSGLKVNITMPIPDALKEYAGNNRVGAVVNGELETLNPKFTTIDGVPSITFTATHFSPYTIYVDTGNMIVSDTLDSTPKTGDGIHPKWFLSIGLACISIILFTKKDRRYTIKA